MVPTEMAKPTSLQSPDRLVHACVNGEEVTYDSPAPPVAAFLERVRRAAADPKVTENDLIALIYGRENPLLDHTMLPGQSMVTPAVFEHPVYRVLTDLLDRKRVALGALDLERARAQFTLTVTEAAEQLGISPQAVRKAVEARRLAAWREGSQWLLDPRGVNAFKLTRDAKDKHQGPSPHLVVRIGNAPGASFQLKHPGELEERTRAGGNVVTGVLTRWKRVAVLTSAEQGDAKTQRLWILEPGGEQQEVTLGDFYARGRFTVVEKINNSEKARAAWKAFEAE